VPLGSLINWILVLVSVATVWTLQDRGAAVIVISSGSKESAPPFLIMSALTVKTNNVPRDLISAFELNGAEYSKLRKEFDWMEDQDFEYAMFFNYRGQVYALADFLRTEGDLLAQGWQGVLNQTYFSGLLVKIVDSCQSVVVGRYCA
jgi:hypothetical protein